MTQDEMVSLLEAHGRVKVYEGRTSLKVTKKIVLLGQQGDLAVYLRPQGPIYGIICDVECKAYPTLGEALNFYKLINGKHS